jgi:hypothetical protein
MFERFKHDLEAQSSPGSSRDGGRLKSRVPRYEKDLRILERKKNQDLALLLEELFWFQDFGLPTSSTSFRFAENTTFRGSLIDLGHSLEESGKSPGASLQLW